MDARYYVLGTTEGWRLGSWSGPISSGLVSFLSEDVPFCGGIIARLWAKIAFASKLNSAFRFPFKRILYPGIERALKLPREEPAFLVVFDHHKLTYDLRFFSYLTRRYPRLVLAYAFTNVVEKSAAKKLGIVSKLKKVFHHVFAFDKKDSESYGFEHAYLVFEPIKEAAEVEIETDVFLIANAKDRFEKIKALYSRCRSEKLACDFYVTGFEQKEDINDVREICHDRPLGYQLVLQKIQSSRCVADIMQSASEGITLNICEAIFFNKKIITDNKAVVFEPFFDPRMIYVLGERHDSLKGFLDNPTTGFSDEVKNLFSAKAFFQKMLI